MSDYYLRDINSPVDAAIDNMFAGQPTRGHTAPRQRWLRTGVSILALGPERSPWVLALWNCALQIAQRQRGEEDLKSVTSVRGKFYQETLQFDVVLFDYQSGKVPLIKVVYRLANVLYYCVQEYVQEYDIHSFNDVTKRFCERSGIPETIAWRCAATKFLDRSARDQSNPDIEEKTMQCILDQFALS